MNVWKIAVGLILAGTAASPAAAEVVPLPAPPFSISITRGGFYEAYQEEDLQASAAPLDRLALAGSWEWAESRRVIGRLSRGGYQIDDPDFPGTLHQRYESALLIGGLNGFALAGGAAELGVGYSVNGFNVRNSARLPGSDPGFLFTSWQLYHGPALLLNYRRSLYGPLAMSWELEAVPYGFASAADSGLKMPSGFRSVRVLPRLSVWDERVSLGYFFELSAAQGFHREASGVVASIALTGL